MTFRLLAAAVLAAGAVSCGEFAVPDSASVPANPVWETTVKGEPDVKTIMENHCNNCHGAHPSRGVGGRTGNDGGRGGGDGGRIPAGSFRTDTYAGAGGRTGAADVAQQLADVIQSGRMPPELGTQLGPHDTAIMNKWAAANAPRTH